MFMNIGGLSAFLYKNRHKVAWVVLLISVLFSVFVRFPTGFFDEEVHYIRAQGIANGQLLGYSKDGDTSKVGHNISWSDEQFINQHYRGDRSVPVSTGWIISPVNNNVDTDIDVYVVNTSAAPYTPVPYISYALGVKFAQIFNADSKVEFIIMRIFGALLTLSMIFMAFRISPKKYKWTILTIALIPMSIASFASISTDGFTIASALLFMASILTMAERVKENKLTSKDILLLGIFSVLLVGAKIPAFLLIALILAFIIIYWEKLNSRHRHYLFSIIFITAILTLLWALYVKDINTGAYWGKDTDTIEQIKFILSHPATFARNLGYAMLNYDALGMIYTSYANDPRLTRLPFMVNVLMVVGLVLSSFVETSRKKITVDKTKLYWAQVVVFIVVSCAIFSLLYLQFTPVGTPNEIAGVQPRYFIPFIGLLLMNPYTMRLSRSWKGLACVMPIIGVTFYLGFIIIQLMGVS